MSYVKPSNNVKIVGSNPAKTLCCMSFRFYALSLNAPRADPNCPEPNNYYAIYVYVSHNGQFVQKINYSV